MKNRIKVGDLVVWRHPSETDVGIVVSTGQSENRPSHYTPNSSHIHWGDGDRGWFENIALEVISESR